MSAKARRHRIVTQKQNLLTASHRLLGSYGMPITDENMFFAISIYVEGSGISITSDVARGRTPDKFALRIAAKHLVAFEHYFGV
jgi:hypothetical protein